MRTEKQNQNMESLSEIKLDLINLIMRVTDRQRLQTVYRALQSGTQPTTRAQDPGVDKFLLGQVDIRHGVSKEQIFVEQGQPPITFQEVQSLMTDEPWEQELEELLANLD